MGEDIFELGIDEPTLTEQEIALGNVGDKYARFKGADWFLWLYKRPVI